MEPIHRHRGITSSPRVAVEFGLGIAMAAPLMHANGWVCMDSANGAAIRFSDAGNCTTTLLAVSR